jgi:adenylate cyclase class IV
MKFKEIEFKYNAKNITKESFENTVNCFAIKPRWQEVSSYDSYFVNDIGRFVRYRYNNNTGVVTTKEKTSDINNQNRVEYNVNMGENPYETVQGFYGSLGFKFNFRIYKICDIAWLEKVDLVYYVIYDDEWKEVDRFIEIEALEDYNWATEQEAWDEIIKYEKLLEPIGITPQHRMKKSLFEMYKK